MEPTDSNNGHSVPNVIATDQVGPIRRSSSRIARLNRSSPQTAHHRPYPPNFQHVSTWLSQNRQMERQRSYYSNYYSSSRNRNSQTNESQNSTSEASPVISTETTPSPSSTETIARAVPQLIERVSEIISLSNAATQTPNTSSSTDSSSDASTGDEADNESPQHTWGPIQEYLRTLGAFFAIGHAGRQSVTLVNSNGPNSSENPSEGATNNGLTFEPINFDQLFAIPDNLFNDGLTKQEINRHTISYEYKPTLPGKRKRTKTDEVDSPSTSSAIAAANDNCSICLDKFNPNVQVRRLPCLHLFHIKCIDKWLKRNKKCPICRISITIDYDTLMSSLESGTSIDQCVSQQESTSSSLRPMFNPTITFSLTSSRGNEITLSGSIVSAAVEVNSNNNNTTTTAASSPGTSGTN